MHIAAIHTQAARRFGPIAPAFAQRLQNQATLKLLYPVAERSVLLRIRLARRRFGVASRGGSDIQIVRQQDRRTSAFGRGAQGGAQHDMFEFADIAGPRIGLQRPHRLRRQPYLLHSQARLGQIQEMVRQRFDIFAARPQRGYPQRKNAQSMVEIGAESAVLNLFVESSILTSVRRLLSEPNL